jgi:nitroreductase
VSLDLVRECIELATQAPTGSNRQGWHFLVVTDEATRAALGAVYARGFELYRSLPDPDYDDPARVATHERVRSSAEYLAEVMGRAPVLVVPCIEGRPDNQTNAWASGLLGSILPAAWSFCLAARARGLGTSWTTLHLLFEEEAATLLGIPYERVAQAALIPVAHTKGTDFRPGPRADLDSVIHLDRW